ncbi:MAG: T9SS type A sorting domain-containing protein [Bacteroidetes bacterium]|nr:T9SS type A sorting domain-containing protein [Bacteroidota bacterium]MCB0842698.1 T9SS type A sorting domain-containing protein [Bacteroidota bacterium]
MKNSKLVQHELLANGSYLPKRTFQITNLLKYYFRVFTIIAIGLTLSLNDLHAGGWVKAKKRGQKYKAKAKIKCTSGGGTVTDKDVQLHPTTANAYARNPSNSFLTLRGEETSWIGPTGWGMSDNIVDNNCTAGGDICDFFGYFSPYQTLDDPVEYGEISGDSIEFNSDEDSVHIPNISGYFEINSPTRTFTFYITVWEAPYNDDEDFEMPPAEKIVWQGSAIFVDGELTLDGFSSSEIFIDSENENKIVFDDFTKSVSVSGAEFDSLEVDIRYETEEDEEELLRRAVEQTTNFAPKVLSFSPNPVSDYGMVSLSYPTITAKEEYALHIFDSQGKLVSTLDHITLSPNKNKYDLKIDLSHLSDGLYYLSASGNSRIFVIKFIKV